jgi:hypothetical protein
VDFDTDDSITHNDRQGGDMIRQTVVSAKLVVVNRILLLVFSSNCGALTVYTDRTFWQTSAGGLSQIVEDLIP